MMALCVIMCLVATNTFAQEKVRGIETKLVKYDTYKYNDYTEDVYGIMFTNRNSIPVSVTMELWEGQSRKSWTNSFESNNQLVSSKDIVLDPNESYLWKVNAGKYGESSLRNLGEYTYHTYYYKYEAYKLQ